MHVVVDTYSSYALGFSQVSKLPEAAGAASYNEPLPLYSAKKELEVQSLLTDNGKAPRGGEGSPYRLYLK
jgi:hypothetical protein